MGEGALCVHGFGTHFLSTLLSGFSFGFFCIFQDWIPPTVTENSGTLSLVLGLCFSFSIAFNVGSVGVVVLVLRGFGFCFDGLSLVSTDFGFLVLFICLYACMYACTYVCWRLFRDSLINRIWVHHSSGEQ